MKRLLWTCLGAVTALAIVVCVDQRQAEPPPAGYDDASQVVALRGQLRRSLEEVDRLRDELARLRIALTEKGLSADPVPTAPAYLLRKLQSDASDPKQVALWKAEIDRRYGRLWKRLDLTPQQVQHFESFLVEQRQETADFETAVHAENLTSPAAADAWRAFHEQLADEEKGFFADATYAPYQADFSQYGQTLNVRAQIDGSVQPFLQQAGGGLDEIQYEELVQTLAHPPANGTPADILNQAAKFLEPSQLQAFQSWQSLQRSRRTLLDRLDQIQRQLRPPVAAGS